MGQKVKHRKRAKDRDTSFNGDVFSGLSNKEVRPAPYSSAYAAKLNQVELSQYLHRIITSNLPYYKALAKFRNFPLLIPRTGQDYKNHCLLSRLTVSGLSVMEMQFAKKPKNPV